jgi:hypothetical protein
MKRSLWKCQLNEGKLATLLKARDYRALTLELQSDEANLTARTERPGKDSDSKLIRLLIIKKQQ